MRQNPYIFASIISCAHRGVAYMLLLSAAVSIPADGTERCFAFSFFPSQSFVLRRNVDHDKCSEPFFLDSIAKPRSCIFIESHSHAAYWAHRAFENALCVTYFNLSRPSAAIFSNFSCGNFADDRRSMACSQTKRKLDFNTAMFP